MVGITGIVATQKNDIDINRLLSQMCESIKHKDKHIIESHISINNGNCIGIGRVHIGIFNPEQQPIFNEDRTIFIVMDGEIYDYQDIKIEDIRNELISRGHKFSVGNDPDLILHLYEEYGKDFIHKLNGNFSIVIWNEKSHELLMASDRYGLRPIYYTNNNGYLLFGSEVKAILQDNNFERIINNMSVAEFFSFGYMLGNKTFFQGIELLPHASIMIYRYGNISIERYWDYSFNKKRENHQEEYYVENLSRLMHQSIERQMKGNHRISVLLSGGLDSRTIAGSIPKKYYPIHTLTYGEPNCYDTVFAKKIAERLGTTYHFFELEPESMVRHIENFIYMSDGMLNIINANWLLSDAICKLSEFSDVSLHGWLADTSHLIGNIENNEDNYKLFTRLWSHKLPIETFKNLFRDDYFTLFEENMKLSKDYILHMSNGIESAEDRLTYINLKERQRRIMVGFIYMRNFLEFRTPFTDYDYIDFNLGISPKLKMKKHIYKKMILQISPCMRDIPYQKTGVPIYESNYLKIIFLFRHSLQILKKIINKTTIKISRTEVFHDERELADYSRWMRNDKNLKKYVSDILLDKRTLERPYFNQKFIKKILDSHFKYEKDYLMLIGLLVTFELWNRQFIDKNS